MTEKLEGQTTDWDSVFGGMKQYLAAIRMPAEFYREAVLKLQEYMLEHHPDELRAECEIAKKFVLRRDLVGVTAKLPSKGFSVWRKKADMIFPLDFPQVL